jgi:hypothetical protein
MQLLEVGRLQAIVHGQLAILVTDNEAAAAAPLMGERRDNNALFCAEECCGHVQTFSLPL